MSLREIALRRVQEFRHHALGHKSWLYVDRQELALGMEKRIKDPNTVYQGGYGTCGPTAIVRDLVSDDPAEYVRLTTSLYWTGRCKIHHSRYAWPYPLMAGYDLRRYNPLANGGHPDRWNVADWMLTATLRDSLNKTFCRKHFFGTDDEATAAGHKKGMVGGTSFEDQKGLFRGLGYRRVHSWGDFLQPATRAILDEANRYLKHHHVQIAIDASLLSSAEQDQPRGAPPKGIQNHWVELLTEIQLEVDWVAFRVFSWGRTYHLPVADQKPLKLSVFEKKFFGYIAAKY